MNSTNFDHINKIDNAESSKKAYAVDVQNLSVVFGEFYAVKKISFQVNAGEIFGFLGANGAGKTTTIRVLCGLLLPSAGAVELAGIKQIAQNCQQIKSKVGYMSQKFTLYDDMTVAENLSFNASLRKLEPAYFKKRQKELLDFISFKRDLNSFVKDLSGGVKQQVSLVASLLHDPDIIFLDEPTAGVTPASRALFWNLIRKLADNGKTVFVTTHYMDEAEQCGRVALMRNGSIIALDSPKNLKASSFPQKMYELEPIKQLSYEQINYFRNHPNLVFFEPYGLRFHASFKTGLSEQSGPTSDLMPELKAHFKVSVIDPTLEDVFIHLVEGASS